MRLAIMALSALLVGTGKAEDSIVLRLEKKDPSTVLEWHSQLNLPLAGLQPEYKIEWSSDLAECERLLSFDCAPFRRGRRKIF
jgi:hypothetical protein